MAKAKRSLIRPPKTTNAGSMKEILASSKYDTLVLGSIQKHIISADDEPRDKTRLHPSEMCKSDWCPRRSFYRISPDHLDEPEEEIGFVLQNIFDEGHFVHAKYQSRLWDMGLLRGVFRCHVCARRWEDTSPQVCPGCSAPRGCLEYREVPLLDEKHLITGHADGDVALGSDESADPLLEIKTIGEGTVRVEYPTLLYEYTIEVDGKTIVDLNGLWGAIKRPFPGHLKQAMLYLYIKGRKRMVFIYECKWNQQTKEFVVRLRPEIVEPLLDQALDVKYGLKTGRPPARPGWAEQDSPTCAKCFYFATCYQTENRDGDEEPGDGAGRRSRGEAEGSADRAAGTPTPAPVPRRRRRGAGRPAEGAPPARRVVRRRPDAAHGRPDQVD